MDFFDKITKKASEAYKITADKTGKIAKDTKIKLKQSELKSNVSDLYEEIGKKVYQNYLQKQDDIPEEIKEDCIKIDVLNDELERLLKHLANNFVTIGMQSALCILINAIIEILYKLANTTDRDAIREVKSRKIVDYSNVIASCSNIVYSMVTQDLSKLDIGGFIVTVYRICTDSKIIEQIRDEFVYGSYEQQLILNEYRREDKV